VSYADNQDMILISLIVNTTTLFLGLLFGSIGMGYLIYGRKQKHGIALISGVALCALPYLVSDILFITLIGVGVMALPFLFKP